MPDIEVSIGGRSFLVSCQAGEEHFLRSAAAQLDIEAQPLVASMGRLPEVKMLLMAGLMLADRAAAQEDEMRELRARLSTLEDRPEPEAKRIEVPVIPPQIPLTFAELAARAEALAGRVGDRLAAGGGKGVEPAGGGGVVAQATSAATEGDPLPGTVSVGGGSGDSDPADQPDADPMDPPPGDPPPADLPPGDLPPEELPDASLLGSDEDFPAVPDSDFEEDQR